MKKFLAAFSALAILLTSVINVIPVHAAGANLIANPSMETSTSSLPTGWTSDSWGTNTHAFTYLSTGHTGSHSVKTAITKYTSGDAKWFFTPVSATPNTSYTYSDWYQSTTTGSIDIVVTATNGTDSYLWQGDQAASAAWKQASYTFTTPANTAKVTVYHYIQSVGQVTIDDASLVNNAATPVTPPVTPPATAPTISVTAPVTNATLSGTTTVTANAVDAKGIANVQFKLDGVNLGAAVTTSPYSVSWNTTITANGVHTLTAVATNTSNLTTTSTSVSVTVNNAVAPTAPTISINAPVANATVNGTATTITATAADAKGIANVQFMLDGVNLGTADTTSPYSVVWDTTKTVNGIHSLTAVATNTSALTTTSATVSVTVNNVVAPTPPTVSISAPTASATVSGGTTTVTATAADAKGVSNVQFKLDGANLGSAVTTSPYSTVWDTTKTANGVHTLTAVATNTSNLTTTSTSVSVTVNNAVVTPPTPPTNVTNLIANPSVETTSGTAPASWLSSNWGTNTSTFTYLTSGHTGSRSLEVQTTAYTNGAANWYYADVPVTAGTTYQYTNWYKSNVDTEVDAEITMNDGTVQYAYLGTVLSNTNWTKYSATYTVPAGAKSMAVYQILAKAGYIITDDYSLNTYTPVPFNRGIVSVSFDDGWANQYANAMPVLKQNGIVGTYNIISGELDDTPDYMTSAQVKALYAAGNEIASHSVSHPDMTTLTPAQLTTEMKQSQTTLQNLLGTSVMDFAYPYGAYNTSTLAEGSKYYASQRTVNGGLNTKDNFNLSQLKIYEVDSNISQAQVKGWIDAAIAQKSWLILVFHEVATTPVDPTDALYTTQPRDIAAEMAYLKSTGVSTQTVHQAITELTPQL